MPSFHKTATEIFPVDRLRWADLVLLRAERDRRAAPRINCSYRLFA